ncbi:hypothetical protein [Tautonia plasticadhaerens]|uniref:Uncharacterized protein n=1 Tax=Tautonia plasticadhaerens TaxID=2527974 RepID=A0A518H9A4_9BACT|nr:hypothetical protein [Tautonia plasticadhaerens]QDV37435.1 hypothetical protein ElP_53740 [Tautonia plasticadhaerens]
MYAEGLYRGKVVSWGWTESSNGHDLFQMTFSVTGRVDRNDPDGPAEPGEPGQRRWSLTLSSEQNAKWLASNVESLGYDRQDFAGLDPEQEGAFNFEGVELLATCKHEEYQGSPREKWMLFVPRRSVPLSRDRVRSIDDRYGHVFADRDARRAARSASSPPTALASAATGDDLPF